MTKTIAAGLLLGAIACTAAHAQDASQGDAERAAKNKISMCIGCHGIQDYRTAYPVVYSVPYIAGQSPAYLASALKAYRSGDRSHPTMQGIAKALSDQDIADLAAFYGNAQKKD